MSRFEWSFVSCQFFLDWWLFVGSNGFQDILLQKMGEAMSSGNFIWCLAHCSRAIKRTAK